MIGSDYGHVKAIMLQNITLSINLSIHQHFKTIMGIENLYMIFTFHYFKYITLINLYDYLYLMNLSLNIFVYVKFISVGGENLF